MTRTPLRAKLAALRRRIVASGADEWMKQVRGWAASFPKTGHTVTADRGDMNERANSDTARVRPSVPYEFDK